MAGDKKIVQCRKCGFKFDISYSRVFVCGECPAILHCSMVKCPNCGHEFEVVHGPRSSHQTLWEESTPYTSYI